MDKQNKEQKLDADKIVRYAIISVVCVLIFWSLTFLLFFLYDDSQTRGQFGDMFGAVNALFSGLAFAGLILTLVLQKTELSLQRRELQLTRDEMANQRDEFSKENETLKYQRFENLFYNMLNLQQKIVEGLRDEYDANETSIVPLSAGGQGCETRKTHREVVGREVFRFVYESKEFRVESEYGQKMTVHGFGTIIHRDGIHAYERYWTPTIFDHYFCHLLVILKFVDSQELSFADAYKYLSYLRGTLSRHELVWIYYYGLQPQNDVFKHLIEKYSLLSNLRPELLTLTSENESLIKSLGQNSKDLSRNGFSGRDFEFYLTDDVEDTSKYQLSAFWQKEDIENGKSLLSSWRGYIYPPIGRHQKS